MGKRSRNAKTFAYKNMLRQKMPDFNGFKSAGNTDTCTGCRKCHMLKIQCQELLSHPVYSRVQIGLLNVKQEQSAPRNVAI
jgi:hypothetical protein